MATIQIEQSKSGGLYERPEICLESDETNWEEKKKQIPTRM